MTGAGDEAAAEGGLSEAARRRILDERTARLAAREGTAAAPETAQAVLVCEAGGERFGLPAASVAEIAPFRGAALVPGGARSLLGLAACRGTVLRVHDLAALAGLSARAGDGAGHLLVLRRARPPLGLRVARVLAVVPVPGAEIAALAAQEGATGLVRGRLDSADPAASGFALLDLDRLLGSLAPAPPSTGG